MTTPGEEPRVMVGHLGELFYPDSPGDALYFYAMHDARPADPDRFPWRCPETNRLWTAPDEFGSAVNVQCTLVNLHAGDCRAEVAW